MFYQTKQKHQIMTSSLGKYLKLVLNSWFCQRAFFCQASRVHKVMWYAHKTMVCQCELHANNMENKVLVTPESSTVKKKQKKPWTHIHIMCSTIILVLLGASNKPTIGMLGSNTLDPRSKSVRYCDEHFLIFKHGLYECYLVLNERWNNTTRAVQNPNNSEFTHAKAELEQHLVNVCKYSCFHLVPNSRQDKLYVLEVRIWLHTSHLNSSVAQSCLLVDSEVDFI